MRTTELLLVMLVMAPLSRAGFAASTAAQTCASSKMKAVATKLSDKAKCYQKALKKAATVDSACLAKAEQKFATAYTKAEAKGGCSVSGDASTVEATVDACVTAFAAAITGDAKCAAAKMGAVGVKAKSKATCQQKALLKGVDVDATCLAKAEIVFNKAITKADASGTCTDTAPTLEALVDGCIANLAGTSSSDECLLVQNTTATSTVNPNGCAVLDRDTSGCAASRSAAGLTGYWLKFSCRVTLSKTANGVSAQADGQPDYKSNYFTSSDPCHETYTGATQNPNLIAAQHYTVTFPTSPDTQSKTMNGTAVVGLAVNGVPVFGNFAAPGDDIYQEAQTFDRCGAHPQNTGHYHYHGEPYAISYNDSNFIGVMRDGYPIYGRKDPNGSLPTLDSFGGHTGVTVDSPTTPVYHYHVNEQTSTNPGTSGQKQWFLTTGTFRGTPGACSGGC